jgi:hypothetical protein
MYPALRMPSLLLGSILLLTLVTYLASCTKKNPLDELGANTPLSTVNERGDGAVSTPGTDGYVSPTPEKDKDAFKDKVNSSYEFTGRSIYEHLAYFQGTKNPLDYFSPSMHPQLQGHLTRYNQMVVGSTIPTATTDAVNYVQSSSDLSASEKTKGTQVLRALEAHANGLMAKVDDGTFDSFGNIWFYLKDQEQTILNDPNLPEDIKQAVVGYYSFMRNYLKYEYGRGGFDPSVDERGDGACVFGIKLKCWLKYGFIAYLKVAAYTLILVKLTALTAGAAAPILTIPYYLLLAATVAEFAIKVSSKDCKCSEGTTIDELAPCKIPEFVGVTLNGCGLTQKLTTGNYGPSYSGDFIWILNGATAPDAGNEGNIVSRSGNTVITNFPWLVVTQDLPSQDIIVEVGLFECNIEGGIGKRPSIFNFHELTVTDPGTISIAWKADPITETNHVVKIGSIQTYAVYGTALVKAASGLNTISIQPNSPYGIVDQILGVGEIKVRWVQYTVPQSPFTYLGKVTATAQGLCNSVSASDDIFVAIQLP